jgi:nucleoside-diphosphate-sugar epimerase
MNYMTCKIALTGATGWFGQTFIKQYIKKYSLELAKKNLFLLSSNGRQLKIPNIDHTFNTIALENIDQLENIDILIHSAFLTKDKIEAISADRFLVINRKITDKVVGFSINKKIKKIFIISSGSARNHDEAGNIYGFFKKKRRRPFLIN